MIAAAEKEVCRRLNDKTWRTLQVSVAVFAVILMLLAFFLLAEPQGDGTYRVGEVTVWTKLIGFVLLCCGIFAILAEVRIRTGDLSLRTFLLAALWIIALAILLGAIRYLRQ